MKMYKNIGFLKKNMMKDKRGIVDIIFFIIFMASLAIFILTLKLIVGEVTTAFLANEQINSSPLAVGALTYGSNLVDQFDYIWLVIFIGFILGTLISSVLIDVHPIFVPIWIILFMISIVLGVIMNNVYADFANSASLLQYSTGQTFANSIIGNYVLVIIGVAALSMILMFGKIKLAGSQRL